MKLKHIAGIFLLAGGISVSRASVPMLDDLAADWMPVADLQNFPSVNNFSGALKTEPNLLGVQLITFAPYSQGGDTAVLSLNGSTVNAHQSRWFPYQVERQGNYLGVSMDTVVRMPFEQQGVLYSITVSNSTAQTLTPSVGVALRGYISSIGGSWTWSTPHPGTSGFSTALTNSGSVLVVNDTQSAAATAFAFATAPGSLTVNGAEGAANWTPVLGAGQSVTLQFVMAVAANANAAVATATNWAGSFSNVLTQAQSLWEQRWESAFQRGNPNYSGSAPVLDTTNATVRQMYYMGVLTALLLERTSLPKSPRMYATAGPQWAVTVEYFWDTSFWADLWAQLDPVIMKAHLKDYLALNIHSCYAKDYYSGNGVGPWYSANDISIFDLWWSYLTATGDWGALNETAGGQTVLQQLNGIALYWQSLVPVGAALADYGANNNLLECDANYIHQVASLNAANVWMMRRMGDIYDRLGQTTNAAAMRATASALVPHVLALYHGDGTWNVNQNGTIVNARHIYDYDMVGRCLSADLSDTIQTQMTAFVENELLVPGWMRAMSLSDPAAANSNSQRPDHGPIGSYDGWPALACGVMAQFGHYDQALDLLQRCRGVLQEGPFSQAHQLLPASDHEGVLVDDYPAIDPATNITVEAWINAAAWRPNYWQGSIVSKDDWSGGDHGYVLRCGEGGKLSFVIAANGSFKEVVSGEVLTTNAWHLVAGTYDGSQIRIYVDGVQQSAVACSGALSASTYPLMAGRCTYATGRTFIGAIDGARVYGRAVAASEIAAQAAEAGNYVPSDTNGLVLYLAFNENSGTSTANLAAAGTGFNGTFFDPTAWKNGIEGGALWVPAPSTNASNIYVRIPDPSYLQDYNEGCGAAFANTIITGLFGFAPGADGSFHLTAPAAPRGFTGTLSGVKFHGASYTIVSGINGVSLAKPQLTGIATTNSGVVALSGSGGAAQTYILWSATNLAPANWIPIVTNQTGDSGRIEFTDSPPANDTGRFYRISTP